MRIGLSSRAWLPIAVTTVTAAMAVRRRLGGRPPAPPRGMSTTPPIRRAYSAPRMSVTLALGRA